MKFKNESHKKIFTEQIKKININNYALLASIYLLTSDNFLWSKARHCVKRNKIEFEKFSLQRSTENGYTLLSAAKDLYLGTKYLSLNDIADIKLIPPKLFQVICMALEIRRKGLAGRNDDKYD